MKNVTRFISAAAALMLVIVSCAKQELPVSTSGFEMNPSPVVASAQGGVYSVAYQISLPEAGATVEAVSPHCDHCPLRRQVCFFPCKPV